MKCRNCGHKIPDGKLYCEYCGEAVQIVPDYNPLDDMLTAQIKVSLDDEDTDGSGSGSRTGTRRSKTKRGTAGGGTAEKKTGGRNTGTGKATGRTGRNTRALSPEEERSRRRQQAARRKEALRRKRRRLLLIMGLILVLIVAAVYLLYSNSYAGVVGKGNKALSSGNYTEAKEAFERAISKNKEKPEAYAGLSKTYIAQDDPDAAEAVFLTALEDQNNNADLYEACVDFYMDTKQQEKIPELLKDAGDSVRKALGGYIIDEPEFSLDPEETFEDVQELTLTAGKGEKIYYTTDESDPSVSSTEYTEPIQISEGVTVITAIAVNGDGVPSLPARKTYTVELPIVDAPAVSPSTGQYEEARQIEIKVPDGYDAYYTMDESDPTTASTKYTGPVEMPEGTTIFKAILVNGQGRSSGITTRNYERVSE